MPQSKIKTKLGNKLSVRFRVVGSLDDLTSDQLKSLALRYIRGAARAVIVAELNAAEPAVVTNRRIADSMKQMMGIEEDKIKAFCAAQDPIMYLEVPTEFSIPLADLIPSEEGTRGKKAGNIWEFEGEEGEDEEEEEVAAETTAATE